MEQRFAGGDEAALWELYQRYAGPMFSTAYHVLRDHDLAADAVQQALIQAWRHARSFDPARALQPWLCTIVRRTAIDVHRRERHRLNQVELDDERVDAISGGPSLESTWALWQVRSALDQLHPDEREVLHLAYFGGMSQSEISQSRGIPLGTVKSRTVRAQHRLAGLLAHMADEAMAT